MDLPFIYGAQYYRAPTPEKSLWADDLHRMADSGFNAVKFFAQWRWIHRRPHEFYFDDLDELMNLAAACGLSVTLNVLFDMQPVWLSRAFDDCQMVTASGTSLHPRATPSRQIGGFPGPCLNHPEARSTREMFLHRVVEHFMDHPAMGMWDIWNEPESCDFFRMPHPDTLLCYCHNCRQGFITWLQERYQDINRLNEIWGRCYLDWDEIELPENPGTFADMIDWRLFNCDSLSVEARRRILVVKTLDSKHPVYLHPVPNTLQHLNSITGADDFQITKGCDCVGGTINGTVSALQCASTADGRVVYNVESHLRNGGTTMYPRNLRTQDIAYEFLPQIGHGTKGFLYWQYRCEVLGRESPAWGLMDVDGRPGLTHASATEFWHGLQPIADSLMRAIPTPPEVAIFRSAANEIFHWCVYGDLAELRDGFHGYAALLYEKNVRLVYVVEETLISGLPSSVRLLVMPNVYALSQPAADALAEWVRAGRTVVCEAHTGGFDLTRGRHSRTMPGLGLAESFGLRECNATAVPHLGISAKSESFGDQSSDLMKAIAAFGLAGGNVLPLVMDNGDSFVGWSRYAEVEGDGVEPIASLPDRQPCVACKHVGSGAVYYIGTLAGKMWTELGSPGLSNLLDRAIQSAGIPAATQRWPGLPNGVRIDTLESAEGTAIVLANHTDSPVDFSLTCTEKLRGVYTGQRLSNDISCNRIVLDAKQAELFVPAMWTKS